MSVVRAGWLLGVVVLTGASRGQEELAPPAEGAERVETVRLWCGPIGGADGAWAREALGPLIAERCADLEWQWAVGPVAADVWLAVPLVDLWVAAGEKRLGPRGTWDAVDASVVEPGGRFALRFRQPWVLAWGEQAFAEPPAAVEDLLWEPRFDQAVCLPTAAAAPELWDGWRQTLSVSFGEDKAQAWLTRLDGRIPNHADDFDALIEHLRAGGVGLLPRGIAERTGGLAWAVPTDGAPRRSLGVALTAGARAGSAVFLARLLTFEIEIAAALDLTPIEPGAFTVRDELEPTQLAAIDRWWQSQVRGRGARLESLDRWLDIVLGLALAALLFGIYRSIRRGEGAKVTGEP